MTAIEVLEYEWEDIGWDYPDYFQGRGVSRTSWDAVFVGIGESADEAANDALDQAAEAGYDVSAIAGDVGQFGEPEDEVTEAERWSGIQRYVALYVRGQEVKDK